MAWAPRSSAHGCSPIGFIRHASERQRRAAPRMRYLQPMHWARPWQNASSRRTGPGSTPGRCQSAVAGCCRALRMLVVVQPHCPLCDGIVSKLEAVKSKARFSGEQFWSDMALKACALSPLASRLPPDAAQPVWRQYVRRIQGSRHAIPWYYQVGSIAWGCSFTFSICLSHLKCTRLIVTSTSRCDANAFGAAPGKLLPEVDHAACFALHCIALHCIAQAR